MKLSASICVSIFAAAITGIVASAAGQEAPQGDVANGKCLYLADGCFTCHGRFGQGGNFNGPAPLVAKTEMPFEAFEAQLRNPANDMPAYSDALLSHQDIADIYAYVESLPGARPAKDISILNN
jgi:mono/diheme cytochrome c family protein